MPVEPEDRILNLMAKLDYHARMPITQQPLPPESLLNTYQGSSHPERWLGQGDCFSVAVERPVSLCEYVVAFYTSPVFRIERVILHLFLGKPSTDADAHGVADGSGSAFAIWRVGERTSTQLLMCDRYERTRSWFQVLPTPAGGTILRFGSAVGSTRNHNTGHVSTGQGFRWLMPIHVLYSRVLLWSARKRLRKIRT